MSENDSQSNAFSVGWNGLTDVGRFRANNEDAFLALNFDAQEVFYDLENKIFNLIYVHKILALFDQVGTFLIPSIVIFFLFKSLKPTYNRIEKIDYLKLFYSFIVLIGITQLLAYISISIGYDFLPESIKSYLKSQQDFNTTLQEKFIGESLLSFTYNILLLTIIPAIGEELFFRGLIQKIFIGIFKLCCSKFSYLIFLLLVKHSALFDLKHGFYITSPPWV